jgi:hypothetical protein
MRTHKVAALIVEHFERRHVSWYRLAPGPLHSAF